MRLWHDDIRTPPDDSWTWARTNAQAIKLLRENEVTEASLDHDLGLDHLDPSEYYSPDILRGDGFLTGEHLVIEMVHLDLIPPVVRVHSWNPVGAMRMVSRLRAAGCKAFAEPFEESWRDPDTDTKGNPND